MQWYTQQILRSGHSTFSDTQVFLCSTQIIAYKLRLNTFMSQLNPPRYYCSLTKLTLWLSSNFFYCKYSRHSENGTSSSNALHIQNWNQLSEFVLSSFLILIYTRISHSSVCFLLLVRLFLFTLVERHEEWIMTTSWKNHTKNVFLSFEISVS